jgi:hypothetical protein
MSAEVLARAIKPVGNLRHPEDLVELGHAFAEGFAQGIFGRPILRRGEVGK